MEAVRIVAAVLGGLAALLITSTVLRVLITPRGRPSRFVRVLDLAIHAAFRLATRRSDYYRRDRVLAAEGPVQLLVLLAAWLVCFLGAYTLLLWPATVGFIRALRESTSSLFSLGFAYTPGAWPDIIDTVAAATGVILVAVQIAYLPTIYSAFNRRETEVTLLNARAGEPSWGPELLARSRYGVVADLVPIYESWERWAADVAESHSNYPQLLRFRSPTPLSSWLVSLIAVIDSAALYSAVAPSAVPVQARLCLRMGFTCLRQISESLGLKSDPDPHPDGGIRLTFDEFRQGLERMSSVGFPFERTPEEAWPHFQGWRINYEDIAYRLAYAIDAVPAPWTGPRRHGTEVFTTRRPPNRTPEDPDAAGSTRA
jgi:hypothetical protein